MTRILCVEDESDIREVLLEVLEEEGFDVAGAANGAEALRMLHSFRPDLVITDMLMPVMSGVEFIMEMRKAGAPFDVTPIIVLSAYNAQAQVDEALAAGACRYLTKPVAFDSLLRNIFDLATLQDGERPEGCACHVPALMIAEGD